MKRSNHKTIKPGAVLAVAALAQPKASTAGAAPGGLPQCQQDLKTCNTNLSTCNSNLSQAQSNLATCNSNLSTCNNDRATCNSNLSTCQTDLAACQAAASAFPATGQTTVHRTGDDGDIQAGATLSYTDNGDGTITDNNTKLTWEKKSNDGTIHDVGNTYTWENAFAQHVAGLNTGNFAGHNDWRLPNVKELQSIVNYQFVNPSVSDAFKTPCASGATVLTGSCTVASFYWSSTTFAFDPPSRGS